jgi:hypothetical protein
MKRLVAAGSVGLVLGVAAVLEAAGPPEPTLTNPWWVAVVAAGLLFWAGMLYWSR